MVSSVLLLGFLLAGYEVKARTFTDVNAGFTCEYNGVKYKKGDLLPTRGQCLDCVCKEGFSEPDGSQCAIIDCPEDWKGDCTPTYEEGECCPVSWNCTVSSGVVPLSVPSSGKCSCPWRYFKHYAALGCKPIYNEADSCCPTRFDCPEVPDLDESVCHHNGKQYNIGDNIDDGCTSCMCQQDWEDPSKAKVICAADGCSNLLSPDPRLKDFRCYEVYEEGSCCPTGVKCDYDSPDGSDEPVCVVDGKIFHNGQKIYPSGMPCSECYCSANWTGVFGSSCRQINCNILDNLDLLKKGCLPIYHEGTCCPIEWHCKTGEELVIPSQKSLPQNDESTDDKNKCKFDGKSYNIGDVLDIHHPTHCVNCTCIVPPDFSCVHKRCAPPPNDDYMNCQSIYTEGECCPKYECVQEAPSVQCEPVQCPESCSEVMYANGCPMCDCQGLLCAPPKCSSECTLDYSAGSCPTCKCPDSFPAGRPVCTPVRCAPQCHEAVGPQGCPMCICAPLCSPPKCDSGCHVETFVLEGQCPGCICPGITDVTADNTNQVPKVLCAPVKCSSYCREVVGPNGCPMCDCGPLCSPPKCGQGCRLEAIPSSGPCPECVCDRPPEVIQCAPVRCLGNCYEVRVPNGCPMCMCGEVLCSPPKCPVGCSVNNDVAPGQCPVCQCPPTISIERPICDPVKCSPHCHEAISPQGCPICICGPLCSPPKCDSGCQVQKEVPEGQCPGCECSKGDSVSSRDRQIQCGTVKCPRMCVQALGDNGCPTCMCDLLCSPPKCDYGCRLRLTTHDSPCPECICDNIPSVSEVACFPPKCDDPGCRIDYTTQPCPSCVCDGLVPEVACSPPKCDHPGCRIDYTTKPCPQCICLSGRIGGAFCSSPSCTEPGCRIDYSKQPCPECVCDHDQNPSSLGVMCSPPKCDELGCSIDYTTQPCPSCQCSGPEILLVPCYPPKCTNPGCHVDYTKKPCPECVCSLGGSRLGLLPIPCSPPKCDEPGCRIDYSTQPCPSCVCDESHGSLVVPCSPPKCTDPGCRIDYTKKPCPECVCDGRQDILPIPCSPPKCDDPGCRMDFTTYPCPSCVCDNKPESLIVPCSPLKCTDPGCRIDYTKKPCPECVCDGRQDILPIPCSPPKCDEPGCRIDYTAYPCPECVCDVPKVSCSMPKCDGTGCRIYYRPNECPECVCDSGYIPFISCSMPRCDPGCRINYTTTPCPSCDCDRRSARQVMCSPPRCPLGCRINYSSVPCPSCVCNNSQQRGRRPYWGA